MKHKKSLTQLALFFSVLIVFSLFHVLVGLSNLVVSKMAMGIDVVAYFYLFIGMPMSMAIYGIISYKITGSVVQTQIFIVISFVVSYVLAYVVWNGLIKHKIMSFSHFGDELLEGMPMLLIMMGVSLVTSLLAMWARRKADT